MKYEVEVLSSGIKITGKDEKGEANMSMTFYACATYNDLQRIEGKVLTLLDATLANETQKKAVKDIFRRMFWFDWAENLFRGTDPMPSSMPRVPSEDIPLA